MGIESLIMLVIYILVIGLVVYALNWLLAQLALPQPVKTIAMIIVSLILLLWLLSRLGIFSL